MYILVHATDLRQIPDYDTRTMVSVRVLHRYTAILKEQLISLLFIVHTFSTSV